MEVREIRPGEEEQWDAYARSCPHSTPQHLIAWKSVMENNFHSETRYFLAKENGVITGILPAIHIKSLLAGNYVTSLPGGICADSDDAAYSLFQHVREYVVSKKAKYLILRDGRKKWELPELLTNDEHVTFLVDLTADLDEVKHNMKKRTRQLVNKVSQNGLSVTIGFDRLKEYYPIYARSMQQLGTPTLGLGFFRSSAEHLLNEIDLITIYHQEKVVGGGFVAPLSQTLFCLWSGLLHQYYQYHISYMLLWEGIKYAFTRNLKHVDLGRCRKDSGGFEFKRQFGGRMEQLYQQIYMNGIGRPPAVGSERASDLKYRSFVKIWQMLPYQATEVLGPILRKQVPFG